MVSNNGFVVIGQDPYSKDFWYHQHKCEDGKPCNIELMGDGNGDVRPLINNYVKKGYEPENIIYNGQPVTDVFTRTTDDEGNVAFKSSQKGIVQKGGNPYVRQVVTTSSGEEVVVPVMMGSKTNVEALDDGTYKVTTQFAVYPRPEPKVTIMTEEELIENFAKYKNGTPKVVDLKA